jgi:phosphoenolpyruvate-protein phosphotransferase
LTLTLLTPMRGWVGPLDEVPDPVFAERLMGDGVAIDPTGSTLHAPCDAEVMLMARTGHSVTLRADNGAEILIHIGLETMALGGEGFTAHVRAGHRVKAGDLLITFDLDTLARRAKSLLTPVLITNPDAFTIVWREADREADVGKPLIRLRAVKAGLPGDVASGDVAAGDIASDEPLRQTITLGLPHGLHARPSGRVAAVAKPFAAEISISTRGRTVNAKSAVSLMTLGAERGDEVVLLARGQDAQMALTALATFLTSDGGEVIAAPAPIRRPGPIAASTGGCLQGVSASPGHAVGRAFQLRRAPIKVVEAGAGPLQEHAALATALSLVRGRMQTPGHGDDVGGEIRAAHLALLDDPDLAAAANALITSGKSAGFAWSRALDTQIGALRRLDDPHLRERAGDLLDLKRQILLALGGEAEAALGLPNDAVLLADDLLPSELMALGGSILGLCTAGGGPTSHVAIIAAALNIPAVVAVGAAAFAVKDGTPVILDADAGTLKVSPDEAELAVAKGAASHRVAGRSAALALARELCRMADGSRIEVFANLAGVAEAAPAVVNGAEGCGLLRSEFLFMDRNTPPSEDEQHAAYQAIADAFAGRPVIIRTMDVGGDKPVAYLALPKEDNPALGLRGVRTSLSRPDLLRTQLRAILRTRSAGVCRILVPMVSSVEELIAVRQILNEERAAMGLETSPGLGVMIETPAAAVTAAAIASEADFLSIGSNDLTQYALAMDRTNPAVAAEVDALHPAVLRLIALTCEGARVHDRPVAICGGLASQPLAAALLIGLGVTELSATPSMIPELKAAIRALGLAQCRSLAAQALAQTSAKAVRALLTSTLAPTVAMETVR